MINAFYSGAAALRGHQTAIDVEANNIANVNTVGFKEKQARFSDLLYSTMTAPGNLGTNAVNAGASAGSGTGVAQVKTDMGQGAMNQTGNPLDFGIEGDGFFEVQDAAGKLYYTRDGSFQASVQGQTEILTTAEGMTVLGSDGNAINVAGGKPERLPGVFDFANAQGLQSAGSGLFQQTAQSGAPTATGRQPAEGKLEASNTDLIQQMSGLMISERAYELSAKAVQTADSIEEMANQLR